MKTLIAATLALTAFHALANDAALIEETKQAALGIPPKLLQMVQEEINKGSHEGAIAACKRRRWPPPLRRTPAGRSAASV